MASLKCLRALFAWATLISISTQQASPSDVGRMAAWDRDMLFQASPSDVGRMAMWNEDGKRICECLANPYPWCLGIICMGISSSQSLQSLSSTISSESGASWMVPSIRSKVGKCPWPASENSSSHLERCSQCFMISSFWSALGWLPWAFTKVANSALNLFNI